MTHSILIELISALDIPAIPGASLNRPICRI
jgi:hypothetical protein